MSDYGDFTPITVRSDTTPIERFPPAIWALAERVWTEMLTVKHPADEFQRLRDIEEIAEAINAERERCYARISASKDLDGSTGEEFDSGYLEAHRDALASITLPNTQKEGT
jgi:hypothetical protein